MTRCPSRSKQGLQCGLDAGHSGAHNALIPCDAKWPDEAGSWRLEMAKMDKALDKMERFQNAVRLAQENVKHLSAAAIASTPRQVDWAETLGENCEGWTAYEAMECSECKRQVVLSSLGECEHRDVEPTLVVSKMPKPGEDFMCPECDHEFRIEGDGDEPVESVECPKCETEIFEGDEFDRSCSGYLMSEGPMMNFFYPVDLADCELAARQIAHLPLCVVEMQDGQTGLALTGGGMDLSPQICRAYMALGYLPPVHFARLPEYAGYEQNLTWVELIVACQRSQEIQTRQAQSVSQWLADMLSRMCDAADEGDKQNGE